MEKIVKKLISRNQTIASMESCTGGLFANEITNINGSSNVFKLGLVTYSNEYKIYFGVSSKTINEYTVYSNEVSREMAKRVCEISKSNYGVGITGQLGIKDQNNNCNDLNTVYITIYNQNENVCFDYKINPVGEDRIDKKYYVVNFIEERLHEICK